MSAVVAATLPESTLGFMVSSDDDDDEDDTAELLAELERIKKERAEENMRKVSKQCWSASWYDADRYKLKVAWSGPR